MGKPWAAMLRVGVGARMADAATEPAGESDTDRTRASSWEADPTAPSWT